MFLKWLIIILDFSQLQKALAYTSYPNMESSKTKK
jgi:hypothetical protein